MPVTAIDPPVDFTDSDNAAFTTTTLRAHPGNESSTVRPGQDAFLGYQVRGGYFSLPPFQDLFLLRSRQEFPTSKPGRFVLRSTGTFLRRMHYAATKRSTAICTERSRACQISQAICSRAKSRVSGRTLSTAVSLSPLRSRYAHVPVPKTPARSHQAPVRPASPRGQGVPGIWNATHFRQVSVAGLRGDREDGLDPTHARYEPGSRALCSQNWAHLKLNPEACERVSGSREPGSSVQFRLSRRPHTCFAIHDRSFASIDFEQAPSVG